jgi:hypothetical protein
MSITTYLIYLSVTAAIIGVSMLTAEVAVDQWAEWQSRRYLRERKEAMGEKE